jgi:hypothetical protein
MRIIPAAALLIAYAGVAAGQDLNAGCQASGWNMRAEVVAFKTTAENIAAGATLATMPPLEIGVLYVIKLQPQLDVQFLQSSPKKSLVQNPLGGLATFAAAQDGVYRITVDSPLWIDMIGAEGTLTPSAFTGWHDCRLFRKSVEYALRAGQPMTLQLSEAAPELVRIVVEAAAH